MKKIVVFQFTLLDESNKELAKEIAIEFSGVTKVVEVVGREGQLEVWGEFSTFELTKELKKIDESVETIKIVPDGVTVPEVKIQQQDVGAGAAGKAIVYGIDYYRKKNYEKEAKAKLEREMKAGKRIWVLPEAPKQGLFEAEKQRKAREEEERSRRKQAEEMVQRKIRLEKETKKMREQYLAIKKEEEKLKFWQEKMNKQALLKKSGGTTTWTGLKGSLLGTTQLTGQGSTWRPLRTGETSASAQTQLRTGTTKCINANPKFNTKTKKPTNYFF